MDVVLSIIKNFLLTIPFFFQTKNLVLTALYDKWQCLNLEKNLYHICQVSRI